MLKDKLVNAVYWVSEKTFYGFTKNIEIIKLRKKLGLVDYQFSTGHYIAYWAASSVLLAIAGIIAMLALMASEIFTDPVIIFIPFLAFGSGIAASLAWPSWVLSKKNKTINANLPLAILTMSTVSEGGAPPQYMFQSIAGNQDYPRLGQECTKIQRFMEQLGLSFSKAVAKEIELTPSRKFQTFLKELNTTIKSGGDLKEFMSKRADDAYFDYMLQLERAGERAETLGEIYSIIMIAAPLFLFFAVMLLGIFADESGLFGMTVDELLNYGIWLVIPLANVVFIMAMSALAPE